MIGTIRPCQVEVVHFGCPDVKFLKDITAISFKRLQVDVTIPIFNIDLWERKTHSEFKTWGREEREESEVKKSFSSGVRLVNLLLCSFLLFSGCAWWRRWWWWWCWWWWSCCSWRDATSCNNPAKVGTCLKLSNLYCDLGPFEKLQTWGKRSFGMPPPWSEIRINTDSWVFEMDTRTGGGADLPFLVLPW